MASGARAPGWGLLVAVGLALVAAGAAVLAYPWAGEGGGYAAGSGRLNGVVNGFVSYERVVPAGTYTVESTVRGGGKLEGPAPAGGEWSGSTLLRAECGGEATLESLDFVVDGVLDSPPRAVVAEFYVNDSLAVRLTARPSMPPGATAAPLTAESVEAEAGGGFRVVGVHGSITASDEGYILELFATIEPAGGGGPGLPLDVKAEVNIEGAGLKSLRAGASYAAKCVEVLEVKTPVLERTNAPFSGTLSGSASISLGVGACGGVPAYAIAAGTALTGIGSALIAAGLVARAFREAWAA